MPTVYNILKQIQFLKNISLFMIQLSLYLHHYLGSVMDLTAYECLIKSEASARKYVVDKCWNLRHRFCPRCRGRKYYLLGNGKRRCKRCGYTFHDRSGRWINRGRLTYGQWLRLVKLFELELSTRKMAEQLGISYKVTYKAVNTIRLSIMAHSPGFSELLDSEIEPDESHIRGRRKGKRSHGAAGKIRVFGILERNGIVEVSVVHNVTARTLLNLPVKKVKWGNIVYTDRYQAYDSLMFCGYRHIKVHHAVEFAQGQVHINGMGGFWCYAKERLFKHHGISPQKFPLYLKEMEFRYNHRRDDIFPIIIEYLTEFVQE